MVADTWSYEYRLAVPGVHAARRQRGAYLVFKLARLWHPLLQQTRAVAGPAPAGVSFLPLGLPIERVPNMPF